MGCRAALAELPFTGSIFSDMLLELFAPQGLKGVATAIQGFEFGGIRPFTAQITPFNPRCFYSRIIGHLILNSSDLFYHESTKRRKHGETKNKIFVLFKFRVFVVFGNYSLNKSSDSSLLRICSRTVLRNISWERPYLTWPSKVRTDRVAASFSLAPTVRIRGI